MSNIYIYQTYTYISKPVLPPIFFNKIRVDANKAVDHILYNFRLDIFYEQKILLLLW